jgi:dipeptidyl aminopeptidase/acylaminoacyl peptidase
VPQVGICLMTKNRGSATASAILRAMRIAGPLLHAAVTFSFVVTLAGQSPPRSATSAPRTSSASAGPGLQIGDIFRLRSIEDVRLSPDATRVAYTVTNNNRPGRPYSQLWIAEITSGKSIAVGTERDTASDPRWSPDGKQIAWLGRVGGEVGIFAVSVTGIGDKPRLLAKVTGTNHPLPSSGEQLAWSPDSASIAFISSTPGPETGANGDPMVITRYLYKPTASEGATRFNDNRRMHIFITDVANGKTRQLTNGNFYEHSIDWSPNGDEILFVSNRGADPDRFFNYDIFAADVASKAIRRITDTNSAEYYPKWSPDGRRIAFAGTSRPLTSSETTMEDTHVWVMNADGSARDEIGRSLDNRQGPPEWASDGGAIYFSLQERGSVRLMRMPTNGAAPRIAIADEGSIGEWSVDEHAIAYSLSTPAAPADLFVTTERSAVKRITSLNAPLLGQRRLAPVESFAFKSFDGLDIEAFLTKPVDTAANHPMIVMMHGGPHGQQGPGFNQKAQIYATQGWATLMVNYRGSTGYGQKLADAIFKDQNGGEAKDVLAGVDAALAKYSWIDGDRLGLEGGSYGGQLTNWLITQTPRFKAAVPIASIANLVSFNYMAYYHDYLAVEFGSFPHERGLVDLLWSRSPIRYVQNVRTPTLLLHGENDNDVPIAEAEQFFIALLDVGVEAQLVRYPREGHGLRETKHVADAIERSIAWYKRHFERSRTTSSR